MLAYGLGDAGTGLAATQLGFYLFPFFHLRRRPAGLHRRLPARGEQGVGRAE